LEVSGSADGKDFRPLKIERQVYGSGQGDYGYSVPILFESRPSDAGDSRLRISMPSTVGKSEAAGSNSAPADSATPQLEISRVEIDF
jgi:hypothetical protein